jgi:nitrous oxide reductase accessory protein NosL
MGHELIPFATKAKAETFKIDHRGTQIVTFDEITPKLVKTLD